ncbi:gliding motility protein GldB [Hoylesella buccalis]|uniref:Gliding motility protein GldB n=2 Tax=Hoylesella buccalis TaxID=28127 RepID=A0A2N6QRU6_9BACT|nr:gliding motility protein GldB [Hoylesella buccalis]
MKQYYSLLFLALLLCSACQLKLKPYNQEDQKMLVEVQRYDRLESRYLTTGDFSALQQMNTTYPMETRTLIEDVLDLGEVNEPYINSKFLNFYQDSLLQVLISDAEAEYADMDDINKELSSVFMKLQKLLPRLEIPTVYAQIGALNQSVVVGDKLIGISLDKYLGENYSVYKKYYSEQQRQSMTREYIVPDCIVFYLLSVYPMEDNGVNTQVEKDLHMAKIMWTANKVLGKRFFKSDYVNVVDRFMRKHKSISVAALLKLDDYSKFEV